MRRNTVALAVVWSLLLVAPLASEGAPAADAGPTVLARAGEVTIDVEEFRAEMARRGGHVPGAYATVEQRRALLDEMIQSRALALAAIAAGYDRAWATILDSNVTSLIAGLALLVFGSGPVRGFAVVHVLGLLTSMFSAVFFSRGLVNFWYGRQRKLAKISIGQIWKPDTAA